ncbi:hypothetical protein ACWDYH_09490 [Nocardia goodfellowii]
MQRPNFVTQADGTVRAYYPGDDWFVVGADREAAITALHAEFDRRIQDPAYVAEHWERTQRHLNGEVTPGFEVRELSTEEYERRTTELPGELRTVDPGESSR